MAPQLGGQSGHTDDGVTWRVTVVDCSDYTNNLIFWHRLSSLPRATSSLPSIDRVLAFLADPLLAHGSAGTPPPGKFVVTSAPSYGCSPRYSVLPLRLSGMQLEDCCGGTPILRLSPARYATVSL